MPNDAQVTDTANATHAARSDAIVKLVPGGERHLAHLSDSELLASTRGLVGKSNQVFAALLVHLAEVEARGIHRTRACVSLYTYCIYELRFSEDAAARRASAARLVKQVPLLIEAIAAGELHLTGLLMLGPHLSLENHVEVLGRAKFRTKKELAKLVRELHPLPHVPDLIQPLGPELESPRNPTWQDFVSSLAPAVRELPPGERPRDWANDTTAATAATQAVDSGEGRDVTAPALGRATPTEQALAEQALAEQALAERPPLEQTPPGQTPLEQSRAALPLTGPQHYQIQFTTTEEHVQLVERARALLARQSQGQSLGDLHLQAMRLLVAALEKRKFAVTRRPRKSTETETETETAAREQVEPPRQRVRHVPAAVQREVFERDGARCTYVDERGERCRETHGLELHHREPFGMGGSHSAANLTLHCPAHNALAAELDFGRDHMAARRDAMTHESRSSQAGFVKVVVALSRSGGDGFGSGEHEAIRI